MEGNYGEDEEFGFARNYFIAKELGGSGKKSSRKLSDIELVDEQVLYLFIFYCSFGCWEIEEKRKGNENGTFFSPLFWYYEKLKME